VKRQDALLMDKRHAACDSAAEVAKCALLVDSRVAPAGGNDLPTRPIGATVTVVPHVYFDLGSIIMIIAVCSESFLRGTSHKLRRDASISAMDRRAPEALGADVILQREHADITSDDTLSQHSDHSMRWGDWNVAVEVWLQR
jgi:hypothetical protein